MERINNDNRQLFVDSLDRAKEDMIPMLPYVKREFHDFDQYKIAGEKSILLRDEIGQHECLYHLYHLHEGDDTLRITLLLPTSWEHRFSIVNASIPRLMEWFKSNDNSNRMIVQSLEHGEVEVFPTLSSYIVPAFIDNGFQPMYRMYMKREEVKEVQGTNDDINIVDFSRKTQDEILDFYCNTKSLENLRYFTNSTKENMIKDFASEECKRHSHLALNKKGEIVGATIVSVEDQKVWIDNFSVLPDFDQTNVASLLLATTIASIDEYYDDAEIIIYLNRNCKEAIKACEDNGMVAFEFWVDLIYDK